MELINDFTIDVGKQQSFKYLWAKQYDHNARRYRLVITNQNVPLALTGKEYIVLSLEDSGGNNYSNTSCPFGDDGYPYITFTDSMLSREGDIKCEIRVYDQKGDSIATTFTFNMEVSRSLLSQSRMVESSEFNILNNLISQAIQVTALLEDFKENKAEIEKLIAQINADITSYRSDYNSLSQQTRELIDQVQTFLTTVQQSENDRVAAENARVQAEQLRQSGYESKVADVEQRTATAIADVKSQTATAISDMQTAYDQKTQDVETRVSDAISDATEATGRANAATESANSATDSAKAATEVATTSAVSANSARDACLAAIETLKYTMVDLDGGEPDSDASLYVNDYNGGEP
nr:MAG TPA: BppU domain protein [Caudoviricetes sp.]